MARPKGSNDKTPRKAYPVRASKDGDAYLLADSGCEMATQYLGRQSACLQCPFSACQLDTFRKRGPKVKLTP